MAKKSSKEIHDTLFKRRGGGKGGFKTDVHEVGTSFQFITEDLKRKAVKIDYRYGSTMVRGSGTKLDFYKDINPYSRYADRLEQFAAQASTPEDRIHYQLAFSTSTPALAELKNMLASRNAAFGREAKKQGYNTSEAKKDFMMEVRAKNPHFYIGGVTPYEQEALRDITGSNDILEHMTMGRYTDAIKGIQGTLLTGTLEQDKLKVETAKAAFEGLNKIIRNIETSGYKQSTERFVEVLDVQEYEYEDRIIAFSDFGDDTRKTLRRILNERIKVRGGTRQLTDSEIDRILENVSRFKGFVKEFETTDPDKLFGEQQPPKEFLNIVDLMGNTALIEDLKLPVGGDVEAWLKSVYAGTISREDIAAFVENEYERRDALEMFDKGDIDEPQIALLNRKTRGLIGAIRPPEIDDLNKALEKGLRRQLPHIGIRVENWFKCAADEFKDDKYLPVLYDLADRVANLKGYDALFETNTEINKWYHNENIKTRIKDLISALESNSGLKADWTLIDVKDVDEDDVKMVFESYLYKYSDKEKFPDKIYDFFVDMGEIKDDRKK